jgi:hypothetical protein
MHAAVARASLPLAFVVQAASVAYMLAILWVLDSCNQGNAKTVLQPAALQLGHIHKEVMRPQLVVDVRNRTHLRAPDIMSTYSTRIAKIAVEIRLQSRAGQQKGRVCYGVHHVEVVLRNRVEKSLVNCLICQQRVLGDAARCYSVKHTGQKFTNLCHPYADSA